MEQSHGYASAFSCDAGSVNGLRGQKRGHGWLGSGGAGLRWTQMDVDGVQGNDVGAWQRKERQT